MSTPMEMNPLSMLGNMYDSYPLREIVNIFKEGKGLKGKTTSVFYILLMLGVKHYLAKTDDIINPLKKFIKSVFRSIVYRAVEYDDNNFKVLDAHITKELHTMSDTKNVFKSKYVNGYTEYCDDDHVRAYYVRFIHNSFEKEIVAKAEIALGKHLEDAKENFGEMFKVARDLVLRPNQVSSLFPSVNYLALNESITNFIDVSNINKSFQPLGILVDGEPGLGKTKFADYAVAQGKLKKVIRLDMTIVKDTKFDVILNKIYLDRDINESTLYVVDELDKYIQYRIDDDYHKLQEKHQNDDSKKPIATLQEHTKRLKLGYMYSLLAILEKDGLGAPCIVMFCANNFDSIFEGIDNKHFESLKSRFMKFKFNRCAHDEIIEYLSFYNNKFMNTRFHEDKFDEYTSMLNPHISLPFRELSHITIMKAYKIKDIVTALNEYKEPIKVGEVEVKVEEDEVEVKIESDDELVEIEEEPVKVEEEVEADVADKPIIVKKVKLSPTFGVEAVNEDEVARKTAIVLKFKDLLAECGKVKGKENKAHVVLEVFELVASPDFKYTNSRKFNKVIVDKYHEMINSHPPIAEKLSPIFENVRYMLEA